MPAGDVRFFSFAGILASDIADTMNTFFVSTPRVWLYNTDHFIHEGRDDFSIKLHLQLGLGGSYQSGQRLFAFGVDHVTLDEAQQALDLFMASAPNYYPIAQETIPRRLDRGVPGALSALWIFVNAPYDDGTVQMFSGAWAVEPVSDIAPGAEGLALFYESHGAEAGTHLVRNKSTANTWDAGERGYAVVDLSTLEFVGYPTGCGTATSVTLPDYSSTYCGSPADAPLTLVSGPSVTLLDIDDLVFDTTWSGAADVFGVVIPDSAGAPVPTPDEILTETVTGALSYASAFGVAAGADANLAFSFLPVDTLYTVYWFAQSPTLGSALRSDQFCFGFETDSELQAESGEFIETEAGVDIEIEGAP